MAATPDLTDANPMMEPAPRELSTRHITRDGAVVAVLRTLDCGGPFKVIAELFDEGPDGPTSRGIRPYTFRDRNEATRFVDDALGSFTYLGCEIHQP